MPIVGQIVDDNGYISRLDLKNKQELFEALCAWLDHPKAANKIGPKGNYGGTAWITICISEQRRAVLNADTKRAAVEAYVENARSNGPDAPWHIIPTRRKRTTLGKPTTPDQWHKLVFRQDKKPTRGWYCYLRPSACGPGQV